MAGLYMLTDVNKQLRPLVFAYTGNIISRHGSSYDKWVFFTCLGSNGFLDIQSRGIAVLYACFNQSTMIHYRGFRIILLSMSYLYFSIKPYHAEPTYLLLCDQLHVRLR